MSAIRNIRMLTRYCAWANTRLFEALAQLPDGAVTATRATGFGNMVNTLNHSYLIDLIWKAHLEGRPHGFTSRIPERQLGLEDLRGNQARVDQWYINYADNFSEKLHNEIVQFKFVDGGTGAMSRGDILLHIVNHKTYHRGCVADMMYQVASNPPVMDLPVFLRDVPLLL